MHFGAVYYVGENHFAPVVSEKFFENQLVTSIEHLPGLEDIFSRVVWLVNTSPLNSIEYLISEVGRQRLDNIYVVILFKYLVISRKQLRHSFNHQCSEFHRSGKIFEVIIFICQKDWFHLVFLGTSPWMRIKF